MPEITADATTPATARFRVRERIGAGLARIAKVWGTAVPPAIEAAETAAGMDSSTPFSPGAPLSPYDGYSRTPRSQNFVPQRNVSARPRSDARVSFGTLRDLIDSYDVAQMAIWHRIDSLRSLDWSLVAADGHTGDISDAVALAMAILRKPDGQTPFSAWLAEYAYDILAYDAGTLWRMRNRAGQVVGLRVVDGTLIAPLLDDWGNPPQAPAPAYVQYINGLPWNWLTTNDLIYQPFRKIPNSPYGRAPLETILLNANTDLRFQAYFLQHFTEGNIPAAFAAAPETWTPQQIEQFQEYWDSFMLGDQAVKSQIKWMPGGSHIDFVGQRDFTDAFSLFLMRKTLAAYHVVPADVGFTENVNKSSGETQRDVQHRIGDVPLASHISDVITAFLQDDLHLPLKHEFDFGEEQDDRLVLAQADDIYIKNGTVSNSDIRELRFGLSEPDGKRVPRFIYSNRGGPVPLSALMAVSGPIDPESGAPAPGAPLPHTVFQPIEGVEANPPTPRPPLAVDLYGPDALPVVAPQTAPAPTAAPVAKDGPTAGITAGTGITSYDLVGQRDDDEDEVVAKEMAAYRRFAKARRRDGKWRDFTFNAVDAATARSLNEAGRLSVLVKQGGVPGLTKRSGMISLDLPAGLIPAIPGGVEDHHITVAYLGKDLSDEDFDTCDRAEAAAAKMAGPLLGTIAGIDSFPPSTGSDGKIPAFVPVTLPGVDRLRRELEDLSASEYADYHPHVTLAYLDEGDALPDPVSPTLVTFTHLTVHRGDQARSFRLGPRGLEGTALTKAAASGGQAPKAEASGKEASTAWPGWEHDTRTADYWAQHLSKELGKVLTPRLAEELARDYAATNPGPRDGRTDAELTAAALAWLETQSLDFTPAIAAALKRIRTDGALIGTASASALLAGRKSAQLGNWKPGDTNTATTLLREHGLDTRPNGLDASPSDPSVQDVAGTRLKHIARAVAVGTAAGLTVSTVASRMRDTLTMGLGAVAIYEIVATASDFANRLFGRNGILIGQWAVDPRSKSCQACLTNGNADPRPLGQPYPSGAAFPPQHPSCACAVLPA